MVERIKALCAQNGLSLAVLEKRLGFANGSVAKSNEKIQSNRLKSIADYFEVSMEYILTGKENSFEADGILQKLISAFRLLNEEGREKLADYADDLVSSRKYIKSHTDRMVQGA